MIITIAKKKYNFKKMMAREHSNINSYDYNQAFTNESDVGSQ